MMVFHFQSYVLRRRKKRGSSFLISARPMFSLIVMPFCARTMIIRLRSAFFDAAPHSLTSSLPPLLLITDLRFLSIAKVLPGAP